MATYSFSKLHSLPSLAALALAVAAGPAFAERPMAVDDAGTLDAGGAKLELGWSRDHRERGWEAAAGYAPIENLELELGLDRARDHAPSPDTRMRGIGVAMKWVPLQADTGLSAGLKLEHGRARIDDRIEPRVTARLNAATLLATWRFESGQALHANAGREWVRASGRTEAENTWGVGFEQPVGHGLELTAEFFGAEESRPNRQVGLRYEIVEGLKLSGAIGRGNDRSIGNVGVAWEF